MKTVNRMENQTDQARSLRTIARAQVKAGDRTGALGWIDLLTLPYQKASALLGVAEGTLERTKPNEK